MLDNRSENHLEINLILRFENSFFTFCHFLRFIQVKWYYWQFIYDFKISVGGYEGERGWGVKAGILDLPGINSIIQTLQKCN